MLTEHTQQMPTHEGLVIRYRVGIEAISPIHIGCGQALLAPTLDLWPVGDGALGVLDIDRLIDGFSDADLAAVDAGEPLGELIARLPRERKLAATRYTLKGELGHLPIMAHSKTTAGAPLIPGSSLKGTLRTALAWAVCQREQITIGGQDMNLRATARYADAPLMRRLLGMSPNLDLLRVLRVEDCVGDPGDLTLARAEVYSLRGGQLQPKGQSHTTMAEVIPAGARLTGWVNLDAYLLEAPSDLLPHFRDRGALFGSLTQACHSYAWELIRQELAFYREVGPAALVHVYQQLLTAAEQLDPNRGFLLPIGWGAGWTSKAMSPALTHDQSLVAGMRARYTNLGRYGSIAFPKTRHLAGPVGAPQAPFGWIKVILAPASRDDAATALPWGNPIDVYAPVVPITVTAPPPTPPTPSERKEPDNEPGGVMSRLLHQLQEQFNDAKQRPEHPERERHPGSERAKLAQEEARQQFSDDEPMEPD